MNSAAATGLRPADLDTAITQPKKVAYLEQTVRAIEQGNLKIRVRSLENEQALARMALSQTITNKLLVATLLLNLGLAGATRLPAALYFIGAGLVGAQAAPRSRSRSSTRRRRGTRPRTGDEGGEGGGGRGGGPRGESGVREAHNQSVRSVSMG